MGDVWVLTSIDGEYDDAEETPIRVYTDEATARDVHAKLSAIAAEHYETGRAWRQGAANRYRPMPEASTEPFRTAAATLGFALADGYGLHSCPIT